MLNRGFTLVELLVAVALGLLVVAAALGFVVQLLRAGSETVLSARLQQEVRTTMSMLVSEVQRARSGGGEVLASAGCFRGAEIAIGLHDGAVRIARGAGVACYSAGESVTSPALRVIGLRIDREASVNDRRVRVEMTAALRHPPAFMPGREVTARQVVALRSNGGE